MSSIYINTADLEKQTLQLAVEAYRVNTCLRLVERNNEEDYVKITKTGRGYIKTTIFFVYLL